jgi:hypothetical protein
MVVLKVLIAGDGWGRPVSWTNSPSGAMPQVFRRYVHCVTKLGSCNSVEGTLHNMERVGIGVMVLGNSYVLGNGGEG